MGRKYSLMMTGPDGSEMPISFELCGPPDAEGFVEIFPGTKIHERDLQRAFDAFKKRGGRVTAEFRLGQGPHVQAHGYSMGVKR